MLLSTLIQNLLTYVHKLTLYIHTYYVQGWKNTNIMEIYFYLFMLYVFFFIHTYICISFSFILTKHIYVYYTNWTHWRSSSSFCTKQTKNKKRNGKKNKPQIKRLLNSFYIFCVSTLFQLEYITLYNIHIEKATNFETYKQSLKSTNTTIQKWESYRNR